MQQWQMQQQMNHLNQMQAQVCGMTNFPNLGKGGMQAHNYSQPSSGTWGGGKAAAGKAGKNGKGGKKGLGYGQTLVCTGCKGTNHTPDQCHFTNIKCTNCDAMGHPARKCTKTDVAAKLCKCCGALGHIKKDCAKNGEKC